MAKRVGPLTLLLLFSVLFLSACDAFETEDRSTSSEGGMMGTGRKMGDSAMPMYDPRDPSYRVVQGQVIAIDAAIGTESGLSTLLKSSTPDWASATDKIRSIDSTWTDIRMELERRAADKPDIRPVSNRFDWYMNAVDGTIRNKDREKTSEAFAELLVSWEQVKAVLRQPAVDLWRLFTAVVLLAVLLLVGTDALLWLAKRLDRRVFVLGAEMAVVSAGQTMLRDVADSIPASERDSPESSRTGDLDLLALGPVRAFARSRYVPLTFQLLMVVLFAYAVYACFVTEEYWHNNLGLLAFWAVFWPFAITLSLVTAGRVWCAVCPLGAISAAAERIGLNRAFPAGGTLSTGVIAFLLFVAVVWLTRELVGVESDGEATAWFFIVFTLAAVFTGLTFRGRAWCRSLCPIGRISGLWAMLSFLELRPTAARCQKCITRECVRGNVELPGCPMGLDPSRLDSNRDCTYCLNCVKTCPHNSMHIRVRMPGAEFVRGQRYVVDVGYALWVVPALVLEQHVVSRSAPQFLQPVATRVQELVGTANADRVWFAVTSVFGAALLLGAYLLATWMAGKVLKWGFRKTFAWFGYAFVPLALVVAGAALSDFLTVTWGSMVAMTVAPFGIYAYVDPSPLGPSAAKVVLDGLVLLLYAVGFGLMLLSPYRIAVVSQLNRRLALTAAAPYALIASVIFWLFAWYHV